MASTPPERNFRYGSNIPDPNSIKTTTMISFIVFAVLLLGILWGLMTFFLDRYYEVMRTQETMRVAQLIETEIEQNPLQFDAYAAQTARSNGLYIRLDTLTESRVYDGTVALEDDGAFGNDIEAIAKKLAKNKASAVTSVTKDSTDGSDNSRLIYATYTPSQFGIGTLFIIAPLYPDQATIQIVKNMLFYISLIVVGIAVLLAFYLSRNLLSPIESITKSARELSKGNYNVRFDGGKFTETKELAKTLNTASYEMEKTEFYQKEIIANVSHDLKTPLTMIRSYAEKIIDISGNNPEKRNSDLHVIISETERLNKLVSEMMTVSNLQSGKVELYKEYFNIVEAAEEVYDSFEILNNEGYDIHFHPCKATTVYGDKARIEQVMSNFVSNAVKYSGDNKYVDIQIKRQSKKVVFHCVDHGLGIPKDEQQHVWDRYYRTSANHERDIEGTGLGLSIVKGILNLHNAAFGVESEEGKGSDFWFEMDITKKPTEKIDKDEYEASDIVTFGDRSSKDK